MPAKKGLLVIISSPSGGGKDAVIKDLLKIFPNSTRMINTTTRPLRPGNVNGVDYFFITSKQFENKINNNEFIEYNNYAGNFYGTEKQYLEEALNKYDLVFTQIEVTGKHNLDKAGIPNLSIFLLPESDKVLHDRIIKRGGIDENIIKERLKIAKNEIKESSDYDFRIVNPQNKLNETVSKVMKIIKKNRVGLTKKVKSDNIGRT